MLACHAGSNFQLFRSGFATFKKRRNGNSPVDDEAFYTQKVPAEDTEPVSSALSTTVGTCSADAQNRDPQKDKFAHALRHVCIVPPVWRWRRWIVRRGSSTS